MSIPSSRFLINQFLIKNLNSLEKDPFLFSFILLQHVNYLVKASGKSVLEVAAEFGRFQKINMVELTEHSSSCLLSGTPLFTIKISVIVTYALN